MNGLDAAIASVRLHAEAALLRRLNAGAGFADPRIASQIYLRDEAALARLAGGTLRPQGTHRKAAGELAHLISGAGAPAPRAPPRPAGEPRSRRGGVPPPLNLRSGCPRQPARWDRSDPARDHD